MTTKVHRVKFYNPKPRSINCVSYSKKLKFLALARGDASIEIWDLNEAPYLISYIPGVENGSVEAIDWAHDRLFTTGLGGALVEWDIEILNQKRSLLLTGSAAWCLDVNSSNNLIAIGTEQGYINLYSIEEDDVLFKKLFDKQEGRVLCCKFDKTGNTLVTGSIDSIRVFNVETGHATNRITVSRRQKEVLVWCVAIMSDNTIVSGDSQGRLTFWDANLGEQIDSFTINKTDILSIAVSEDEKSLFCSGMDPVVSHFVKVDKANEKKFGAQWVKNIQRHIHEHDVRALTLIDNKLLSVGDDGYLTFSKYPPKWVMRIPPLIPKPRFGVSAAKKLLLLRYSNYLEIWKLGSYFANDNGEIALNHTNMNEAENKIENIIEEDSTLFNTNAQMTNSTHVLKLSENPLKLATIQAKKGRQIKYCELSPNGEFVVYVTDKDIRMLKLDTDDDQSNVSISKLRVSGVSEANCVAFGPDSRSLVVHSGAELHVLQVDPQCGASLAQTISLEKHLQSKRVIHLLVTNKTRSGETYIVVADVNSQIVLFVSNKNKYSFYASLPRYQCIPSAMTVDMKRETLVIVYVNQMILEYEFGRKKLTGWPGAVLPAQWLRREAAFTAVCAHPHRDALVLQDDTSLWILERNDNEVDCEPQAKRNPQALKTLSYRIIPQKYVAGFSWVGGCEAVSVEVPPQHIVAQLPPPAQTAKWPAIS